MNEHIEHATDEFRRLAGRYLRTERYYAGNHDLAFATDKFKNAFGSMFREFALNLCPAICDAIRDKLRITGFSTEHAGGGPSPNARAVWQLNQMGTRAGEVHKEALKNGDAYAIVWPDAEGRARIHPNRAASCTVTYDEETPGKVLRAAKYWRGTDKRVRLNIFYPDRIEKYVARAASEGSMPDAGEFARSGPAIPNPYGIVPVFHFANNADVGSLGRSELEAAIPIQDGLNKSTLDMLVAMEYAAYRQRWAAGIEIEYDVNGRAVAPFTAGVDHVWMTSDPDTKFGDFNTTNLEQFLKVKDAFRIDIASVTGTPLYYFTPTAEGAQTGIGLRRSESRFLAKVRERQASFGQVWADVMAFALAVEGSGGVRLLTEWEDPAPVSERELLENILLKKQIGLSVQRALLEAGYGLADVNEMAMGQSSNAGGGVEVVLAEPKNAATFLPNAR